MIHDALTNGICMSQLPYMDKIQKRFRGDLGTRVVDVPIETHPHWPERRAYGGEKLQIQKMGTREQKM